MNLKEFLQAATPSKFTHIGWIKEGPVKAYMRSGNRFIDGAKVRTLTIAAVEVDEGFRGQGHFKRFVELCSIPSGHDALYVECINEKRLVGHFERVGWTKDKLYAEDFNFFKRFEAPAETK